MIALIALALITSEPAPLLGGPEAVKPEPQSGATVYAYEDERYRAEGSYTRYREERSDVHWAYREAVTHPNRPTQAGDPVQLDEGFFQGSLVGGVGSEPQRPVVVHHRGRIYYRWR